MTKNEIADVLTEIGTLLELKGENPFKVRAYQTGARALEAVEEMDAGPIWGTRSFPLDSTPPRKGSLYNGAVADAAIELILEVVAKRPLIRAMDPPPAYAFSAFFRTQMKTSGSSTRDRHQLPAWAYSWLSFSMNDAARIR